MNWNLLLYKFRRWVTVVSGSFIVAAVFAFVAVMLAMHFFSVPELRAWVLVGLPIYTVAIIHAAPQMARIGGFED